ncbi:oligoendopeptidase F [bacterium]|nr:MAG: oligoendopeptidase F [bacterium]
MNTVPARDAVADHLKWDLDHIYPDKASWASDLVKLETAVDALGEKRGAIDGAQQLFDLLQQHDDLELLATKLWWYPGLMHDEDLRNNDIEEQKQQVQLLLSRAGTESAWVHPAILELTEPVITEWLEKHEGLRLYHFMLTDLFRQQEHVLDEERETLLSYAGPLGSAPADTYSMLSTADAQWPTITLEDGEELQLTYAAYQHLMITGKVQADRRKAFDGLYGFFRQHRNTYASLYGAVCHRDWFQARSRDYATTLDAALHGNAIPAAVVENLVASTRDTLAPLHRYQRLRKEVLGLDSYHLYDGMVPLLEDSARFDWDSAKGEVIDSVAPLGADYQERMRGAFDGGWIDVSETEGKRSGAYSAPVYGVHPYVLLNYKETRSDLFTLAHEMGHSLHTVYSHESQPYCYSQYTIFVAEVASTLNEGLLLAHLLEKIEHPRERALLLQHAIDSVVGTFYTQVMFADFELQAHRAVEEDQPVTADSLDAIYQGILEHYHGDALTLDEAYRSTWMRIPHLYRSPYYVYQYATCFASAAMLIPGVLGGDEGAVERYLGLLKSGGSEHPMDQLRRAGVDLAKPETVGAVAGRLDELVSLLEEALAAV